MKYRLSAPKLALLFLVFVTLVFPVTVVDTAQTAHAKSVDQLTESEKLHLRVTGIKRRELETAARAAQAQRDQQRRLAQSRQLSSVVQIQNPDGSYRRATNAEVAAASRPPSLLSRIIPSAAAVKRVARAATYSVPVVGGFVAARDTYRNYQNYQAQVAAANRSNDAQIRAIDARIQARNAAKNAVKSAAPTKSTTKQTLVADSSVTTSGLPTSRSRPVSNVQPVKSTTTKTVNTPAPRATLKTDPTSKTVTTPLPTPEGVDEPAQDQIGMQVQKKTDGTGDGTVATTEGQKAADGTTVADATTNTSTTNTTNTSTTNGAGAPPAIIPAPPDGVPTDINSVIKNLFNFGVIAGGIIFMIMFLTGAISYLTGAADPDSVKKARGTMTNSIVGIILTVGAWALASFIGRVLNVPGF